jgi:acyl-homoserine lactone acylase PvdQ
MSKESKPRKPRSSTKKSTSELEAKIAELEAKLGQLSSKVKPAEQHARPAGTHSAPPPAPKPRPAPSGPTHGTLPAGMAPPPKPKEVPASSTSSVSSGEVAPAYATISSTGYTGNKYFATRARLSYHPPDKQFRGQSAPAQTVQVAPEPPKPKRGTLPAGWKP